MNRYRFFCLLSRAVLKLFFRIEVYGLDNVPPEGPFIIAPNHVSFIDPVAAGAFIERDMHYMARDSLFRMPLLGRLIRWCNAFPVSRDSPGAKTMKKALSVLKGGGGLLVFPEGRRSINGKLQKGTPGIGMLSVMAGAPVIPALIMGTDNALPVNGKWIRFAKTRVYFCRALRPPPVASRDIYQRFAGEIMAALSEKLEEVLNAGQNNIG